MYFSFLVKRKKCSRSNDRDSLHAAFVKMEIFRAIRAAIESACVVGGEVTTLCHPVIKVLRVTDPIWQGDSENVAQFSMLNKMSIFRKFFSFIWTSDIDDVREVDSMLYGQYIKGNQ
jgi:hypothetical protein